MADTDSRDDVGSPVPSAPAGASEQPERERRLAALHALAQHQAQSAPLPTPSPAARKRQSAAPLRPMRFSVRSRWIVAGAAGLAVMAVLAGILFWTHNPAPAHRAHSAPPLPGPLVLSFTGTPPVCPEHAAWSPDGTRIAVVGFASCDASAFPLNSGPLTGSTLAVYDATTGALTRATDLGTPLLAGVVPLGVRGDPAQVRQIVLVYDQVLWSPDGQTIALPFNVLRHSPPSNDLASAPSFGRGPLLVTTADGAVRILMLPDDLAPNQQPPSSFAPLPVVRWDLTAGTAALKQVPQALAYSWSGDGTLTASLPLPATPDAPAASVSPADPIGNLIGGATFTAWQTPRWATPISVRLVDRAIRGVSRPTST